MALKNFDTLIIGAGAAGLICAGQAATRGRKVLLIDHAKLIAEKIRISGGGRCNFTNLHSSPENFLSQNSRFAISALARFTPADFIAMVEQAGIAYHEKTLGQLFCDDSATQIIQMLEDACPPEQVTISTQTSAEKITKTETGFDILLSTQQTVSCDSLVIATGGPSIPKMGSSSFGYKIAEQFGLTIIPPRPGLVPFTLSDKMKTRLEPLSGVALDCIATCGKTSFREAMLFTHRGLSGPAILQISSYWQDGQEITLDLAPDHDLATLLKAARQQNGKQALSAYLGNFLPASMVEVFTDFMAQNIRLGDLSDDKIDKITAAIKSWTFTPQGTEGFRTAEVTVGGVSTDQISAKTFETKTVPGLYFIGETLDVTGHLGGHNFQWAWASGHACGEVI